MLSRSHPLLRRLRALRTDAGLRRSEGVIVAEGIHLVQEALAVAAEIEALVCSPALMRRPEGPALLEIAGDRELPVHETSPRVLDSLQDARSPQPVLALVRWQPATTEALLSTNTDAPLLVVAHGVQDPGNLGGLIRTSAAAGAAAVIASGPGADPGHPRAVRASAGAIFRVPVAVAEIEPLLRLLRGHSVRTVGTSPLAERRYDEEEWDGRVALIVGGEGAGIPSEILRGLDSRVAVPMFADVESLSVGAAAAVVLFEAARRRR